MRSTVQTRLLPRVKREVRAYLKNKAANGGFSQEGLLLFLGKVHSDPVNWAVSRAADELLTILWRTAWREVHDEGERDREAQRRREILELVQGFVDVYLDGDAWRDAHELLGRSNKIANDEMAWKFRSDADKTALNQLCKNADIEEVDPAPEEEDHEQLILPFTLDGGTKKLDAVVSFPDATIPGKMRSVYAQFCTLGQYERHTTMSRDHVVRADERTKTKEETLAWLLDVANGNRNVLVYDLRDGAAFSSQVPPEHPRP